MLRKVKYFAQSHTASKLQNWDFSICLLLLLQLISYKQVGKFWVPFPSSGHSEEPQNSFI